MKLGKLQTAWIDALKSGKFRQTTGQLCQVSKGRGRYCCLGVYCKVFDKLNPGVIEIETSISGNVSFDNDIGQLTEKLRKSLRMKTNIQDKLISFNDDDQMTFKQIASKIEANPATYFYGPA